MALSASPASVARVVAMATASMAADPAIDSMVFDLDVVAGAPTGVDHFVAVFRGTDGTAVVFGHYSSDDVASMAVTNRRAFGPG